MEWIFHKLLSNNSIYILVSGSARSIDPCTLLNRLLTLLIDAARETAEEKRSKGAPPEKSRQDGDAGYKKEGNKKNAIKLCRCGTLLQLALCLSSPYPWLSPELKIIFNHFDNGSFFFC